MKQIEMEKARKIEAATKRMIASLDPALAEKLVLKEGTVHPYLELPGCFNILLGAFAIHRVYYYQADGNVYEAFCTRATPSEHFKERLTPAQMMDHMAETKYLWLPKDSPGLRPSSEWDEEE